MKNIPPHCQRGYIQIDLNAIRTNIENLHKIYPAQTKILAVIKTDGYGHGAAETGRFLTEMECLYGFAVATPEEAFELRDAGIEKPVLVMGHVFPYAYERLLKEKIAMIIFRADTVEPLRQCAERLGERARIHIEVDTGMNRLGIKADDQGLSLVEIIARCPHFYLEGIYTHFARADEADKASTWAQLNLFRAFVARIENELKIKIPFKHCSNSAGMLGFSDFPFELGRPGIAIYGIWPSAEAKDFFSLTLLPALSFYSQIVMIKDCPPGTPVSYGGTFVTARPTKVATVPIGYGDGYPRHLSNTGYVLIRGKRAPVIGRVCMDFFMADVTDIPGVRTGDRVTLIGSDGGGQITLEEISALSGRFHYELACDFGKRVPRLYKS